MNIKDKIMIISYDEYIELEKYKNVFESLKSANIKSKWDAISIVDDLEISNWVEFEEMIKKHTDNRRIRHISIIHTYKR